MSGYAATTSVPDAPVYLDFNATTPVAESVLAEMLPWFSEQFGNAASTHGHGQLAAAAVQDARAAVGEALGARILSHLTRTMDP